MNAPEPTAGPPYTPSSVAARDALLDELERAFREFAEFVRDLPRELWERPVPGEEGSVRAILAHVVDAGYRHAEYVAESCGGARPERGFPDSARLHDPESFVAALLDVPHHARVALAPVEDEALEKIRFRTGWGGDYDGEQMLEHATCHPGRHVRQLRRFLGNELG